MLTTITIITIWNSVGWYFGSTCKKWDQ